MALFLSLSKSMAPMAARSGSGMAPMDTDPLSSSPSMLSSLNRSCFSCSLREARDVRACSRRFCPSCTSACVAVPAWPFLTRDW